MSFRDFFKKLITYQEQLTPTPPFPWDGMDTPIPPSVSTPPKPPMTYNPRPLVGPIRVADRVFEDSTGPRRIFGASWFGALRTCSDDFPRAMAQLDAIANAGYQVVVVFPYLGRFCNDRDNPAASGDVFYGMEVGFDHTLNNIEALLKNCVKRGLRLHLMGDKDQVPDDALVQFWSDLCTKIQTSGMAEWVSFVTCFNEANLYMSGDEEHTIELSQRIMSVVRATLTPFPLCTVGSFNSDDPSFILRSGTGGDFYDIHDTMLPEPSTLKRIFGRFYNEGNPRAFRMPFLGTEPHGPGAGSSHKIDDPDWLFGEHAMYALTGMGSYYFCGDSAFYRSPLENSILFNELPRLLSNIPEDIGMWKTGPGGGWWFSDGKKFAVLDVEDWGTEQRAAIATWKIVTASGETDGAGDIPAPAPGYKVRLIVGEYA